MAIEWIGDRYLIAGIDPPTVQGITVLDVQTMTADGTLGPLVQHSVYQAAPPIYRIAVGLIDDRIAVAVGKSTASDVVVLDQQLAMASPMASYPYPIVDTTELDGRLVIAWKLSDTMVRLSRIDRDGAAGDQLMVAADSTFRLARGSRTEAGVLGSVYDATPTIRTPRLRWTPLRVIAE